VCKSLCIHTNITTCLMTQNRVYKLFLIIFIFQNSGVTCLQPISVADFGRRVCQVELRNRSVYKICIPYISVLLGGRSRVAAPTLRCAPGITTENEHLCAWEFFCSPSVSVTHIFVKKKQKKVIHNKFFM